MLCSRHYLHGLLRSSEVLMMTSRIQMRQLSESGRDI